jgi:hypothetical protein
MIRHPAGRVEYHPRPWVRAASRSALVQAVVRIATLRHIATFAVA